MPSYRIDVGTQVCLRNTWRCESGGTECCHSSEIMFKCYHWRVCTQCSMPHWTHSIVVGQHSTKTSLQRAPFGLNKQICREHIFNTLTHTGHKGHKREGPRHIYSTLSLFDNTKVIDTNSEIDQIMSNGTSRKKGLALEQAQNNWGRAT